MSRPILKIFSLALCLCLAACVEKPGEQRAQFYVFGTLMEVSLWDTQPADAKQAFTELQEMFQGMHSDWHAWEPGQLTEINRAFAAGLPALASPSIIKLIRHSQQVEKKTAGRFNPAIGGLIRLWGFHTSDYPVIGPPPRRSQINELAGKHPSSLDIRIDGLELTAMNPSIQLDFGGIAKGYAIDVACALLKSLGVENAIVNAGGDLRAMGSHGTRPWRIAVRNPAGGIIGTLETSQDEAVFTSGVYERFRQDEMKRYPHILDPRTGWPVENVASVTVITREGWLADAAATAIIVAGLDEWQEVAGALGLNQVLLVDESGKVWLTEEMAQRIEFVEGTEKEVVVF
jgi:thiamine biosynthesis lipoprotein